MFSRVAVLPNEKSIDKGNIAVSASAPKRIVCLDAFSIVSCRSGCWLLAQGSTRILFEKGGQLQSISLPPGAGDIRSVSVYQMASPCAGKASKSFVNNRCSEDGLLLCVEGGLLFLLQSAQSPHLPPTITKSINLSLLPGLNWQDSEEEEEEEHVVEAISVWPAHVLVLTSLRLILIPWRYSDSSHLPSNRSYFAIDLPEKMRQQQPQPQPEHLQYPRGRNRRSDIHIQSLTPPFVNADKSAAAPLAAPSTIWLWSYNCIYTVTLPTSLDEYSTSSRPQTLQPLDFLAMEYFPPPFTLSQTLSYAFGAKKDNDEMKQSFDTVRFQNLLSGDDPYTFHPPLPLPSPPSSTVPIAPLQYTSIAEVTNNAPGEMNWLRQVSWDISLCPCPSLRLRLQSPPSRSLSPSSVSDSISGNGSVRDIWEVHWENEHLTWDPVLLMLLTSSVQYEPDSLEDTVALDGETGTGDSRFDYDGNPSDSKVSEGGEEGGVGECVLERAVLALFLMAPRRLPYFMSWMARLARPVPEREEDWSPWRDVGAYTDTEAVEEEGSLGVWAVEDWGKALVYRRGLKAILTLVGREAAEGQGSYFRTDTSSLGVWRRRALVHLWWGTGLNAGLAHGLGLMRAWGWWEELHAVPGLLRDLWSQGQIGMQEDGAGMASRRCGNEIASQGLSQVFGLIVRYLLHLANVEGREGPPSAEDVTGGGEIVAGSGRSLDTLFGLGHSPMSPNTNTKEGSLDLVYHCLRVLEETGLLPQSGDKTHWILSAFQDVVRRRYGERDKPLEEEEEEGILTVGDLQRCMEALGLLGGRVV
eukprot:gene486-517_t